MFNFFLIFFIQNKLINLRMKTNGLGGCTVWPGGRDMYSHGFPARPAEIQRFSKPERCRGSAPYSSSLQAQKLKVDFNDWRFT